MFIHFLTIRNAYFTKQTETALFQDKYSYEYITEYNQAVIHILIRRSDFNNNNVCSHLRQVAKEGYQDGPISG